METKEESGEGAPQRDHLYPPAKRQKAARPSLVMPPSSSSSSSSSKYAIVGMGCRFPGANTLEAYWRLLVEERNANTPRADNVRWGDHPLIKQKEVGFVEGADCFDPAPFGISHAEAASMEPDQRKLLEVVVDAVQDAGLKRSLMGTNVGVFIGAGIAISSRFVDLNYQEPTLCTSTANSIVANRVSHVLGFTGPSMVTDTACSSAAVALSTAVRHGRAQDCDLMIVGGVSSLTLPGTMSAFSKLGVLSETGCKPFSADADGYGRSEGWGAIVLKRLDLAERDGDRVYAVVVEAHSNHDGHAESLTMPCVAQQEALLQRCYPTRAEREALVYMELHGTGTPVGDPREAQAIATVTADRTLTLPIGSVKGNIGHMECCSAMGSIIKCAMMLHRRTLVPSIRCNDPSPTIDWARLHLQRRVELIDAPAPVIGINSFGFGGSNAHVVLEGWSNTLSDGVEARTASGPTICPTAEPWVLGAYDKVSLAEVEQNWIERSERGLPPCSYTMCCRSIGCPYLVSAIGLGERSLPPMGAIQRVRDSAQCLVYAFCGQGVQHPAMGAPFAGYSVYAATIRQVSERYSLTRIGRTLTTDVATVLLTDDSLIHRIEYAIIGIFAHQVGLVRLLRSVGVEPSAVLGHSVGEFAALYCAGCLELPMLVHIIAARAWHLRAHDGLGSMLAVSDCPPIDDIIDLWVSARNTETSLTLGGTNAAVEEATVRCAQAGVFHRRLKVTNAYHTPLLQCMESDLCAELLSLGVDKAALAPTLPLYSTVTGMRQSTPPTVASLWSNVVSTVEFAAAVQAAHADFPNCAFVEPNPHPVLRGYLSVLVDDESVGLGRRSTGTKTWLQGLVTLQVKGHRVEWGELLNPRHPVELSGYPFRKISFPLATVPWLNDEMKTPSTHPLLHRQVVKLPDREVYETNMNTISVPLLRGHQVQGTIVVPATAFLEICIAAGTPLLGNRLGTTELHNFQMKNALVVDTTLARSTAIKVDACRDADGVVRVRVTSGATEHCCCEVASSSVKLWTTDSSLAEDATSVNRDQLYAQARAVGLEYGEEYKLLHRLAWSPLRGTGVGEIDASHLSDLGCYTLDPRIMDDCLHACLFSSMDLSALWLPKTFQRVAFHTKLRCMPAVVTAVVRLRGSQWCISVLDTNTNEPIVSIEGFDCTKIPRAGLHGVRVAERASEPAWFAAWHATLPLETQIAWASEAAHRATYWDPVANSRLAEVLRTIPVPDTPHGRVCARFEEHHSDAPALLEQLGANYRADDRTIDWVVDNIGAMLRRERSTAEVFNDSGLGSAYSDAALFREAKHLRSVLKSLLVTKASVRVLEVGGGTGGLTRHLLDLIDTFGGTYVFTDVSSQFLSAASDHFQASGVAFETATYEVGASMPASLRGEGFDLIVGFDVVHATPDVQLSVDILAGALRPGGVLALVELSHHMPWCWQCLFASFDGWHAMEDGREGCLLPSTQWEAVFDRAQLRNVVSLGVEHGAHFFVLGQAPPPPVGATPGSEMILVECSGIEGAFRQTKALDTTKALRVLYRVDSDDTSTLSALESFIRSVGAENSLWDVKGLRLGDPNIVWKDLPVFSIGGAVTVLRSPNSPKTDPAPSLGVICVQAQMGQPVFRRIGQPLLGPTEVRVRPVFASLNFKDVAVLLRLFEYETETLGVDLGGVVIEVGNAVDAFAVGDWVVGFTPGTFAQTVVLEQGSLWAVETEAQMKRQLLLVTPMLTAWDALLDRARIQAGTRVLVHSATGSLGLAALAICRDVGAVVVATAGTERKRAWLREHWGDVVSSVHNSRDLSWTVVGAVDVVLNSLAGEALYAGLALVRARGHFLDVSKKDALNGVPLDRMALLKNVSYHSIHLDLADQSYLSKTWRAILQREQERGTEWSLPIDRVFPIKDLEKATHYMAQGVHIGKILLRLEAKECWPEGDMESEAFRRDRTYLFAGGLGEMGLMLMQRVVDSGARYLVVSSRSGARTQAQREALVRLRVRAQVVVSISDIRTEAPAIPAAFPPVACVFHMAMVLRDGLVASGDWAMKQLVWDTKVHGAQTLLRAFGKTMDLMICFSSLASIVGNPGQAVYTAANGWMNGMVHPKVRSICIGAIDDSATFAHNLGLRQAYEATHGPLCQTVNDVWSVLEAVVRDGPEKERGDGRHGSVVMLDLRDTKRNVEAALDGLDSDPSMLLGAIIAEALHLPTVDYDETVPWTQFGADSLSAVDIVNRLERAGFTLNGAKITQMMILGGVCSVDVARSRSVKSGPAPLGRVFGGWASPETFVSTFVPSELKPEQLKTPSAQHVLLTGGSGFLGSKVLKCLVERGVRVTCLMHRTAPASFDGVNVLKADLVAPQLGLPFAQYTELLGSVNVVLHAGATMDFVSSAAELFEANVRPTMRFMEFVANTAHCAELIYLSSWSVFPDSSLDHRRELQFQPAALGYTQTKWMSEQILLKSRTPCTICRLGRLIGPDVSPSDSFVVALRACIESGLFPASSHMLEPLTSCEAVAQHLARLCVRVRDAENDRIEVVNLIDAGIANWNDVFEANNIQAVAISSWVSALSGPAAVLFKPGGGLVATMERIADAPLVIESDLDEALGQSLFDTVFHTCLIEGRDLKNVIV